MNQILILTMVLANVSVSLAQGFFILATNNAETGFVILQYATDSSPINGGGLIYIQPMSVQKIDIDAATAVISVDQWDYQSSVIYGNFGDAPFETVYPGQFGHVTYGLGTDYNHPDFGNFEISQIAVPTTVPEPSTNQVFFCLVVMLTALATLRRHRNTFLKGSNGAAV